MSKHFTIVAEIRAEEFFAGRGVNWKFCMKHAAFRHQVSNEFILHVGSDQENSDVFRDNIGAMTAFGCTFDFIEVYREAASEGATRVLFYV